jgi:hypothetical protein
MKFFQYVWGKEEKPGKHYILMSAPTKNTTYCDFSPFLASQKGLAGKKKVFYSIKYDINCLLFDATCIKYHQPFHKRL